MGMYMPLLVGNGEQRQEDGEIYKTHQKIRLGFLRTTWECAFASLHLEQPRLGNVQYPMNVFGAIVFPKLKQKHGPRGWSGIFR